MDAPRSLPHPGVRFPPPLLLAVAFLLGWALETRLRRLHIAETDIWQSILTGVGTFLLVAGLATVAWGMLTFARSRTAIVPFRPASQLVMSGPYRYTRNPMYVERSGVLSFTMSDVHPHDLATILAIDALIAGIIKAREIFGYVQA